MESSGIFNNPNSASLRLIQGWAVDFVIWVGSTAIGGGYRRVLERNLGDTRLLRALKRLIADTRGGVRSVLILAHGLIVKFDLYMKESGDRTKDEEQCMDIDARQ